MKNIVTQAKNNWKYIVHIIYPNTQFTSISLDIIYIRKNSLWNRCQLQVEFFLFFILSFNRHLIISRFTCFSFYCMRLHSQYFFVLFFFILMQSTFRTLYFFHFYRIFPLSGNFFVFSVNSNILDPSGMCVNRWKLSSVTCNNIYNLHESLDLFSSHKTFHLFTVLYIFINIILREYNSALFETFSLLFS